MTRTWMGVVALFLGLSAQAAQINVKQVSFSSSSINVTAASKANFSKISVQGLETSKIVGAPELPVKSYLLQGTPQEITVALNVRKAEVLENTRPYPVQHQECRCEVQRKPFAFEQEKYDAEQSPYTLNYLGAFRGTPITQLVVNVGSYDAQTNSVKINTEMEIAVNAVDYSFEAGNYKDYVIIVPEKLAAGVEAFVAHKTAAGYSVVVEKILSPANEINSLQSLIKKHYENGADFAIIVGDDTAVPMFKVRTSGSYQTPTDLLHFTMDGAGDHIPDMFYSRIIASTADQVAAQLAKSAEFESRTQNNVAGLGKVIGVASNEGYNPSDKDYVMAVNEQFVKGLGVKELFLYQNDKASNPTTLNNQFNEGAFWMTYLGHGSGYSWGNFNVTYNMSDFAKISNKDSVKPIIIDVACMNGRITEQYLGAASMKVDGAAHGAAAFYGGTVNISWHPPAVMARGIAIEHNAKKFKHIGEALMAGNIYLAANWTNVEDVVDNYEWYHLQGDPGMLVNF